MVNLKKIIRKMFFSNHGSGMVIGAVVGVAFMLVILLLVGIYAKVGGGKATGLLSTGGVTGLTKEPTADCNMAATNAPELRDYVKNKLNTSGFETSTSTIYLYDTTETDTLDDNTFYGTLAGVANGYQSVASGLDCKCGRSYTGIRLASSTESSSTFKQWCNELGPGEGHDRPNGLIFRVYDNDAKNYVYSPSNTGKQSSGIKFYSTTDNTTDLAVGNSGYDYTIEIWANDSRGTDGSWEDEEVAVLVDSGEAVLWDDPSTMDFAGIDLIALKSDCFKTATSLGFDWCYYTTKVTLGKNLKKLRVVETGTGSNDPTEDVKITFATKGKYLSTTGKSVKTGYQTDADSPGWVVNNQTIILGFS